MSDAAARSVACPTCMRRVPYTPANRWRPFCSERCRSIDLGAWASERFRVLGGADPANTDSDPVPTPPPPRGA